MTANDLSEHPLTKRAEEYGDYEGPLVPAEPTKIQIGSQSEVSLYGHMGEQTQQPIPPGMGYYGSPEEMPNYEKLNRFERAVFNWLPGFAESKTGLALAKFNESWAGKLLMKLDVLAEGMERGTGLTTQWLHSYQSPELREDFKENYKAAWFAGSLAGDAWFDSMPDVTPDGNLRWSADTPGNPTGADQLRMFRNEITGLMKGGMEGEEALIQVRDKYYDSLGALAIRAQMGDAVFHILADPLNIVMGFLHPVERTAKFRRSLSLKVFSQHGDEAADAVRVANETLEVAEAAYQTQVKALGGLEDIAKVNTRALESVGLEEVLLKTANANIAKTKVAEELASQIGLLDEPLAGEAILFSRWEDAFQEVKKTADDLIRAEHAYGHTSPAAIAAKNASMKAQLDFRQAEAAKNLAMLTEPGDTFAIIQSRYVKAQEDLVKAQQAVDDAIGKLIPSVAPMPDEAAKTALVTQAANLADARKEAEHMAGFLEFATKHKMNWAEEKIYHILRADPLYVPPDNLWTRLNPFALTRSSRAHELMNTILENINTRVFGVAGTGPDEWVRAIERAQAGFWTKEFGHSIVTAEGRAVQSTLEATLDSAKKALAQYDHLEMFEGPMIRRIGDLLDVHPSDILRRLADGEEAALATQIAEMVAKLGDDAADLPILMRSANLTMDDLPEALNRLKVYDGFELYTPELFRMELANRMTDRVAELSIAKWGIRQQGAVHRYADAIKAAESLAFLKMNPAYPIRNGINNFFTSVGRGVYGNPFKNFDNLFVDLGIPEPSRFRSGIGWGGLVEDMEATETIAQAYASGSQIIRETERPMTGRLGKFTSWIQGKKGLGFGKLAQDIESKSSVRAYGVAFSNYMQDNHKMGTTLSRVADFDPELATMLGPQRTKILEQAIQSNWSEPLIRKAIFEDNAHINITSILDDAAQRTGLPIENILGPDFTQQVGGRLAKVAREGGEAAVKREMKRIKKTVQMHIEDHVDNVVNTMYEETAARVAAEGPGSFPSLVSDGMDDLMTAQHKHAIEMADIGDMLRNNADAGTLGRYWDNLMDDNQAFFRRNWQRMDARVRGVRKGIDNSLDELRRAGNLTPEIEKSLTRFVDDFEGSFTSWRKGWDDYFTNRTDLYQEVRKMRPGEKRNARWNEVQTKLDVDYKRLIEKEAAHTHKMDKAVSKLLPDEQAEMFMIGRKRLAGHRKAFRDEIVSFRNQVRHMPKEVRENAWKAHWKQYMDSSKQIAIEERTMMSAMMGDPAAQEMMGMVPEEITTVLKVKQELLEGKLPSLKDEYKDSFAKMRERIVETPELQRLRGKFGEYDPATVDAVIADQLGDWEQIHTSLGSDIGKYGIGGEAGAPGTIDAERLVPENIVPFEGEEILTDVGSAGGTMGSRIMTDAEGTTFIVKKYADVNQTASESLAYAIYRQLGIAVPESKLTTQGGVLRHMSKQVDGVTLDPAGLDALTRQLQDGFVADAFMGNWDVLGTGLDNIVVVEGVAYRVDHGGSFFFRAQGGKKEFGDTVAELVSMRDPSRAASEVFGDITEDAMQLQARSVAAKLSDDFIDKAVDGAKFEDAAMATELKSTLKARRDNLAEFGGFDRQFIGSEGVTYHDKIDNLIQDYPLESVIDAWVRYDSEWKTILKDYVARAPEQAKHTQDVAQWVLREMGFEDLKVYSGKMDMFITTKGKTLDDVQFRPFDSLTASEQFADGWASAQGYPYYFEFEVPVDNIFTHHIGSPSFKAHPVEAEFLLNDLGYEGVRMKKLNGEALSPEQIKFFKEKFPNMLFDEPQGIPTMASFHDVVKQQMIDGKAVDELWYLRGNQALDAIEDSAINVSKAPPFKMDVPEGAENMLRGYMDKITTETSDNLYRATRMGEWGRDSALLNYNRRFNYNTWLGTIAPYEFWATQTAWNWALHSIDKPAMLTTYLRMKKLMATAGKPSAGFPSRLKQHMRIRLPFLPEWMGNDVFVDPLSTALPMDNFARPFERMKQQAESDSYKAERVLEELMNDGKITQEQFDEAVTTKEGSTWERAVALGRQDDTENRQSGFDFMSMMISPHAPILWAYNLARGTPENIGPFMPLTRSVKSITALLGVGPNQEGINIEGKVREMMGLPAFDKWDDYRVDRMLSNMAGTQEITVEEALRAMIEREGDIYMLARRRAAKEHGVGMLGSTIGVPVKAYPLGEENIRELKPLYEDAWTRYEGGDINALNDFYEKHPEYETRLALWDTPEERMQSFMVDQLWSMYHDMPNVNKWEVSEQLGDLYQTAFLNKDTRNYDAIPLDTMQHWVSVMGGDPPGTSTYDAENVVTPFEMTDTATARQVQVFYDVRERMFQYREEVKPLQDKYFQLEEGAARRAFRNSHPALEGYWDWKREFLSRNPSIAPYIEDDPDKQPKYESEAALDQAYAGQPSLTRDEWRTTLGYSAWNVVEQHIMSGGELEPVVLEYLQLSTGQDPNLVLSQISQVLAQ